MHYHMYCTSSQITEYFRFGPVCLYFKGFKDKRMPCATFALEKTTVYIAAV